jgi:hypothetical protein
VTAPLFAHRPEQCPFGHSLTRGKPQLISWQPCLCAPAREAASRGRGMGHLRVQCWACHEEGGRETLLFEPAHDITHRSPGYPISAS